MFGYFVLNICKFYIFLFLTLTFFSRHSGKLIDMKALKADALGKLSKMSTSRIRSMNTFVSPKRVTMEVVVKKLGQKDVAVQKWLILTPKEDIPQPEKEFFPR